MTEPRVFFFFDTLQRSIVGWAQSRVQSKLRRVVQSSRCSIGSMPIRVDEMKDCSDKLADAMMVMIKMQTSMKTGSCDADESVVMHARDVGVC